MDQLNFSGIYEELQYPYFRFIEGWYFSRSEREMRE